MVSHLAELQGEGRTANDPVRHASVGRTSPRAPESGTSLVQILTVLLRERRLIAALTLVGVLAALGVALLRDPKYTTTFSFVPQASSDGARSGLASLAGQFGLNIGATGGLGDSPELYADLVKARAILEPIARDSFPVASGTPRVPLADFLEISGSNGAVTLERTIRALQKAVVRTEVATRTTGVVTVDVRTESPHVSLAIAQRLLQGVNDFNLDTRQTQAGAERRFAEARLAEAERALREAESEMQRFLLSNRQISGSPALTLQRDRLQRAVRQQEQIVSGLVQAYEEARLNEVRNTPVITVIEQPVLAAQHDPRGRLKIMLAGTLIGGFLGIAFALLRDGTRQLRARGALNSLLGEWRTLRGVRD